MTDENNDLRIKIDVDVDDKKYVDLKKDLKENRNNALNFKVPNKDNPLMQPPKLEIPKKDLKPETSVIKEKGEEKEQQKEGEEKKESFLKDSLEVSKKSYDALEGLAQKFAKKDESGKESNNVMPENFAGFLSKVVDALTWVQRNFSEKINKELDLASLAYQTNTTIDAMAKLSYQSKNVGLSLNKIVHSAETSAESLMSGQDDKKTALFAALGMNPIESLRGIKTLEDYQQWQVNTFKKARAALMRGNTFPFLATKQAAELTGISESEAYNLTALNTPKNLSLASEIQQNRGSLGNRDEVLGNYMEITTQLQNRIASMDKLLSREDIAKKIAIGTAEISASSIKFINTTLDLAGFGEKGSFASMLLDWMGINDSNKPRSSHGPSASSQVKGGSY